MDARKKEDENTNNEDKSSNNPATRRLRVPGSSKGARITSQTESGRKSPKPTFTIFESSHSSAEQFVLPRVSIEEESPRIDHLGINSSKK